MLSCSFASRRRRRAAISQSLMDIDFRFHMAIIAAEGYASMLID